MRRKVDSLPNPTTSVLFEPKAAIEEAARQYAEIVWMGGEPITSPEAIFENLAGRKVTAEESKGIMRRVKELLEGHRRGQSKA